MNTAGRDGADRRRGSFLRKLEGADRRCLGRVEEVIAEVEAHPELFPLLVEAMVAADARVAMRAADAVEKISARHAEWLRPFTDWLIAEAARSVQQEVRWHFAQICPRLILDDAKRRQVVAILECYLADGSAIVKTFAMQALADLALADGSLRPRALRHILELTETGTPAMRARGRRLLALMADEKKGAPRERCARGVPLRRE
jgi:hypothetical protein